ncbi:MAG: DUF535 domain-containing protein [Thiobacillus sp.]|nr:DUF535 domain-containing protein [Thiobacillus sp.]
MLLTTILSTANVIHPGLSPRALKRKILFARLIIKNARILTEYIERLDKVSSFPAYAKSPAKFGMVEWPYIDNSWDTATKFRAVANHYEYLATQNTVLNQDLTHCGVNLLSLSCFYEATDVVIDMPKWFIREGELVLNVFVRNLRVASIAFTVGRTESEAHLTIGAIQGIHSGIASDESLTIYRDLTKAFEGLRPRSLLIEILRIIARQLNIDRIYAVSDEHRHHRHSYFGLEKGTKLTTTYNEIWAEHGGILSDKPGFYELPTRGHRKSDQEIPSKKRAMYRRRYEILEYISSNINIFVQPSDKF